MSKVTPDFVAELLPNGNFKLSWDDTNTIYTSIGVGLVAKPANLITWYEIRQGVTAPVVAIDMNTAVVGYTSNSIEMTVPYPCRLIAAAFAWGDLTQGHKRFDQNAENPAQLAEAIAGRMARKG